MTTFLYVAAFMAGTALLIVWALVRNDARGQIDIEIDEFTLEGDMQNAVRDINISSHK